MKYETEIQTKLEELKLKLKEIDKNYANKFQNSTDKLKLISELTIEIFKVESQIKILEWILGDNNG